MAISRSGAKITWTPQRAITAVRKEMESRMKQLGPVLQAKVRENVSVSTAAAGPSKPGEFPHLVSGDLKKGVYWKMVSVGRSGGRELVIGATAMSADGFDYAMFHEYTSGRSYLRRTINEMWSDIFFFMTRQIPGFGRP